MRYRITLEVDTPSGLKTGSSVLESVFSTPPKWIGPGGSAWTYGQAPYVDLGNGTYMFALLVAPHGKQQLISIAKRVLEYDNLQPHPLDRGKALFRQANASLSFADIRRQDYPMLVTFGDASDPKTVRQVNPDNLAGALGAEYSIRRITLQVVEDDEPLTEGIERKFAWMARKPDSSLAPMSSTGPVQSVEDAPLYRLLSIYSFVLRGFK